MERKLFRYRLFDERMVNEYSFIHQKLINIEKWKYEAFEGLVYPSSPLFFNDPYDCEFCFQSEAWETVLDRDVYINILERKFSLKKNEKDRILYSNNIERAFQMVLQARGIKLSDSLMNIYQDALKDAMCPIKDMVRVVCLSEVCDSILMWSHYAKNHTGFCIEYHFKESDMFYKHLYPVIYTNDRYSVSKADIINEEWIQKTICSKSDVWSYEKEWRIVTANFDKIMQQKIKYLNEKYVFDLRENIKAFYLGAKISRKYKEELIQFGKKNNIDIYQMVLSPSAYELNAERII